MQALRALLRGKSTQPDIRPSVPLRAASDVFFSFRSFEEWKVAAKNPLMSDSAYIEEIVRHAQRHGASSTFLGEHIPPAEVTVLGPNYRETLLVRGLNPRLRAVLDLLAEEDPDNDPLYSIYAPEALTPFAMLLRSRYPRFIGSEYVDSEEARSALFPIPVEDLLALSFPSGVFDCVLANEVFEHIPDLAQGIREIHRVLKPSGVLIATFPFSYGAYETLVKARVRGPEVELLCEPEYHGNPAQPEKGSLVFQIPGWSVLDECRATGFSEVEMLFVSSMVRAITGEETSGVYVLRCRKAG